MIQIEHIFKTYGNKTNKIIALDDISLTIETGDIVAIMGKSGAGKTTLMNILGGLDNPDSGTYIFDSTRIGSLNNKQLSKFRNENIGFVYQDFALLPHKSVAFNVSLPMYFDHTPFFNIKKLAQTSLELVNIASLSNRKVDTLSGGQKQRVAIARAIVKNPKLILADEPTGSLDSKTGKEILNLLRKLNTYGTTILIVTHDIDVASCCNKVITISDGKITSIT